MCEYIIAHMCNYCTKNVREELLEIVIDILMRGSHLNNGKLKLVEFVLLIKSTNSAPVRLNCSSKAFADL